MIWNDFLKKFQNLPCERKILISKINVVLIKNLFICMSVKVKNDLFSHLQTWLDFDLRFHFKNQTSLVTVVYKFSLSVYTVIFITIFSHFFTISTVNNSVTLWLQKKCTSFRYKLLHPNAKFRNLS